LAKNKADILHLANEKNLGKWNCGRKDFRKRVLEKKKNCALIGRTKKRRCLSFQDLAEASRRCCCKMEDQPVGNSYFDE
jgi:hypothetical protein